jgi:adenine-specific DNA-methyltransferase
MAHSLIEFAAEQQRRFDAQTSPETRKARGHFGTPPAIAEFMAGMFTNTASMSRVLDAGAGVGMLSAAICQRCLELPGPLRPEFELWENDPALLPFLEATMRHCASAVRGAGHSMEYTIQTDNFVLANARKPLFDAEPRATFDWAIMNPPYFKLRKDSAEATAMAHVVHGQPNIYALFMAAAVDLLRPGGQLVAITPRSYFNGPYFRRFRKWLFDRLTIERIHVFDSRSETFCQDDVLQENVILLAKIGGPPGDVLLTSSSGRDLRQNPGARVAYDQVVSDSRQDNVIRIPGSPIDREIVGAIDRLPRRFRDLGFEVSTGPVVAFRATEFLREERGDQTAPLLWMHNVRPFRTQFPPKNGKSTHILVSDASRPLLLPADRYVLLKRFTAKEEQRRLVAGILEVTDCYSPWVGLENHLNYVHRKGAPLTRLESYGLAAYFNSSIVDRYFRAISGNTQVNAAEIRSLPMPDESALSEIGETVASASDLDNALVDQVVGRAVRLPPDAIARLAGGNP